MAEESTDFNACGCVFPWDPVAGDGTRLIAARPVLDAGVQVSPDEVWESLDGSNWHQLTSGGNGLWTEIEYNNVFLTPTGLVVFDSGNLIRGTAQP